MESGKQRLLGVLLLVLPLAVYGAYAALPAIPKDALGTLFATVSVISVLIGITAIAISTADDAWN